MGVNKNKNVKANEDDELFNSANEEVIYEILSVKRNKNNMKTSQSKKKLKEVLIKKKMGQYIIIQ